MPAKRKAPPKKRQSSRAARMKHSQREADELALIGVALSSERNVDALLELILRKAREITAADAGSLYLLEEDDSGARQLRFKLTQNDTRAFSFNEGTLPLTEQTVAGYTALHGRPVNVSDVYRIPHGSPYSFSDRFDRESGYRTRSLLSLPMQNARGELLGVLQLINCKRNPAIALDRPAAFPRNVKTFSARAQQMGLALASLAAVAYENSRLYASIEKLFEGFVEASVKAIEQRDPTTYGHSFRVSLLTLGLAETVDLVTTGPYAGARISRDQMKEINFASMLHDFGKVGVREEVLVKAKKLYPLQLENVRLRFDYIRKELEARYAQKKIEALLRTGNEDASARLAQLDSELARQLRDADDYLAFVLESNEPALLKGDNFDRLAALAERRFLDPSGIERPYLNSEEIRLLSIPRGSLDENERKQIESHVTHSFDFLRQIPWTKELRRIPQIAWAHHEKLDGTGYPRMLRGEEIPLPARMMAICDIFDALSASDRPYKKAVPVDRALDILSEMVRAGQLEAELFRLFREAKIFERTGLKL
jgi:HD-GYP domain-containing protein (c-di-GMP phosphodiesterase class II)